MTVLLAITYLGVSYGEYQYFKLKVTRQQLGKIMTSVNNVKGIIEDEERKFITLDGMLAFADVIEDVIDDKINNLREELKGVASDEVDTTKSKEEV